jgi:hypothetical protein
MDHYDVLDLDERQIDLRLGEALLRRDHLGATDLADSDKIAATEAWFARTRQDIALRICHERLVVQYLSKDGAGERELLDAIVSAVGFLAGVPVPLSLLGAKVIRFGVSRLCRESSDQGAG